MYELILPMTTFAAVAGITPGPNNLLLTTSGLRFGFRRTLPHLLGVCFGFPVMALVVGLGLAGLFATSTLLHKALKVIGLGYLVYLAYKIATAPPVASVDGGGARPMRFIEAAMFQWVNPKAWVAVIGAISSYTTLDGNNFAEVLVITAIFFVITFPCTATWAAFGTVMRRWLSDPYHIRIFNITMAAALLASIVPMVLE